MDILEEIIATKYKEVEERKALYPVKLLEKSIYFEGPTVSLKNMLPVRINRGLLQRSNASRHPKG